MNLHICNRRSVLIDGCKWMLDPKIYDNDGFKLSYVPFTVVLVIVSNILWMCIVNNPHWLNLCKLWENRNETGKPFQFISIIFSFKGYLHIQWILLCWKHRSGCYICCICVCMYLSTLLCKMYTNLTLGLLYDKLAFKLRKRLLFLWSIP